MKRRFVTLLVCVCLCFNAALAVDVTLTVGGDALLGGNRAKKTDARFDAYFKSYGAGYTFKNYIPLFSSDDITLLNLEAPLKMSANPYTRSGRHDPMHGRPEYVSILTSSSVEAVNVANNHMNDYNTKKATLQILTDSGIAISDSGFSPDTGVISVKGLRVGLLGYKTPCSLGGVRRDIKKARAQCEIVIVSFHFCGVAAYSPVVTNAQIRAAHAAVSAGADLVLGHHPHVVSGIERYKGKHIFYDLGSLVSSGKDFRPDNIVSRITLTYDPDTREVTSSVPVVYPGRASGAGDKSDNNCQPILYAPSDARYSAVFAAIDKYSTKKGIIAGEYARGFAP